MKRPNAAGSDGGAIPPRPPLAHAGARWTTTSTLTPRAFERRDLRVQRRDHVLVELAGRGLGVRHSAHRRTQSAPSRSAVRGIGFVLPERLVDAGLDGARAGGAQSSRATAAASRERSTIASKVSAARRRATEVVSAATAAR